MELCLTCNHDGLGVAAQAVLQQPGQHRVSVGDEAVPPPPASSGQGAAVASQRAAVALRGHAVDALTAAGHLGVLGCERDGHGRLIRGISVDLVREGDAYPARI